MRFDGGHKPNVYIVQTLGKYFQFKSFCPEVDIGLGVPGETLGLIEKNRVQGLVFHKRTNHDVTDPIIESAARQVEWQTKFCGYILKSKSPSCGMRDVKITRQGIVENNGINIYAAGLMQNFPNLPVESEERLNNIDLHNNFIRRVFVYQHWKTLINTPQPSRRMAFS